MSDQNVFVQPITPTQEPVQADALTTKLLEIKNEHGAPKYADVSTALEALKHSQTYIPELKTQLDAKDQELLALRTEIAKMSGVQETLERFRAAPQATEETPAVAPTEQSIEEKVLAILNQQSAAQQAQSNFSQVNTALIQAYGEKAPEVVAQKAAELGMTADALQNLSKDNPKLVLSLFKTNKPVSTPDTLQSSLMSSLNPPQKQKLGKPEKSMLMGSTFNEVNDFLKQVKAEVYDELGVQI